MNVTVYQAVTGDYLVDAIVRGRALLLTVEEAKKLSYLLSRTAAAAQQANRERNANHKGTKHDDR